MSLRTQFFKEIRKLDLPNGDALRTAVQWPLAPRGDRRDQAVLLRTYASSLS
jgi:hypothetical protein